MRETWVQSLGREDLLEKEMTTHSSILAWKIPWMVEPGRLQSMGSQRVRHDWATSLHSNYGGGNEVNCDLPHTYNIVLVSGVQHGDSVFLPGESHGRRSLVGYGPWGCKELDTTEWLHFHFYFLLSRASLVAQLVKNLPAMQEMWLQSLGREDPLEKEMTTHSSILARESHGQGVARE